MHRTRPFAQGDISCRTILVQNVLDHYILREIRGDSRPSLQEALTRFRRALDALESATHMGNILAKLDATSCHQAAAYAVQEGLIHLPGQGPA